MKREENIVKPIGRKNTQKNPVYQKSTKKHTEKKIPLISAFLTFA